MKIVTLFRSDIAAPADAAGGTESCCAFPLLAAGLLAVCVCWLPKSSGEERGTPLERHPRRFVLDGKPLQIDRTFTWGRRGTHRGAQRRVNSWGQVNEFTRECLSIDVSRRLNSEDVLERLTWLMVTRGVPNHIRSDNGPEFTAKVVRKWLERVGVRTLFIEPGSPWENGYVESFNGKLADELLEREVFYTLHEAKVLIERWRILYNTIRPHSALGYRPPAPEAIFAAEAGSAALRPPQQPIENLGELT